MGISFTKTKLLALFALSTLAFNQKTNAQVAATCNPTYSTGCTSNDDIDDVTLVGASVTLSNLNTPCPAGGYQDFTTSTTLAVPDLIPGQSYNGTVTTNYTGLYEHVKIWIDFDDNGTFIASEEVAAFGPINNTSTGAYTISIPLSAAPGMKRMRVVLNYNSSPSSACGSFTWGETHDYKVQILSLSPCTNPAVAGAATFTPSGTSCPGFTKSLGLSGITLGGGQTYEWESSPNNTTYTSLGPAQLGPNLNVAPIVTTWYRCKVVCSNGTPQYSTPIQIIVAPGLSGTYTVNAALATGGTNFTNFTDLATALNCGIVAPVTVNVVAGSGPYIETFALNNIGGSSATNRVRINGNGETIQFNATSTSNHRIVSLNGTKYLTIDSLKIKTLNASYGWGIHITGNASHDSILRCTVDLSTITGASSANANGIVASGSNTSVTTGSAVSNLYIGNNKVIAGSTGSGGGYYGISFYGASSSNPNDSIFIVGNEVTNFYYYGINNYYSKNGVVNYNNVHRSTKTAIGTSSYGINNYYCQGIKVIGNKVHDMAAAGVSSTSTFYGIYNYHYNNTAATPILVANNIVYNLGNYGGTQYLMYNYGEGLKVYHNTVNLNVNQGTSTSTIYGMYNAYNNSSEVKNNIINITGGNLGTKYGIYQGTTAASVLYHKNNVYVNTTQSGTQSAYYWGTAYATLAAFQAAQPTQEIGSPSVAPAFTAPATGDLTPANGALIGTGSNVFAFVPTDIINTPRSSAPTIGAFEIAPIGNNNARMFSILSPADNVCTGTQTLSVVVGNAGVNNITNVQINWSLNGVTQTPFNFSTPTYPTLYPSTAGIGQFMDTVTIGSPSLIAGPNVIKVWTSMPNGMVDAYPGNDSVQTTITPATFALTTINDTVCNGATFLLNLTPSTPYANNSLQWENSTNGGTTWNTLATNSSSNYTATNITANTSYRVKILTGGNTCYSPVKNISVYNVQSPIGIGNERCGPGTLTLSANVPNNGTIYWYNAPNSYTPLGTGQTFTTPNINATTTYYITSGSGGLNQPVGIATPFSTTGTTTFSNYGIVFNATGSFTINAVDVYPISSSSNPGTVTIELKNAAGTTLLTNTANVTSAPGGVLNTIPLNFPVVPGTGYRLVVTAASGITSLKRETVNVTFPYTIPNVISLTSSYSGSSTTTSTYYYLYNWKISTGCESVKIPVVATVHDNPTINLGADKDTCIYATQPIQLSVGTQPSGSTYIWDNNTTGSTRAVSQSGTYYVNVTNQYNCSNSDTINIIAKEKPVVEINTNNDNTICIGMPKTLDAGTAGLNGGSYYWNTGAGSRYLPITSGGTYSVYVTNAVGCSSTDTVVITEAGYAPTIDGIITTPLSSDSFNFLAINPVNVVNYEWNFGDNSPISTAPSPNHKYLSTGTYLVTLKFSSVCGDIIDSNYVHIIGLGINDQKNNDKSVMIYPNPNKTGKLNIVTSSEKIKINKVLIYNSLGQEVLTISNFTKNQNNVLITLPSHLNSGHYFIKIATNNGEVNKQLEILK